MNREPCGGSRIKIIKIISEDIIGSLGKNENKFSIFLAANYNDYKIYMASPESAANAMVCLINQTNQLLDQKLRWTEDKFVKEGGFRENLFKKRMEYKNKNL